VGASGVERQAESKFKKSSPDLQQIEEPSERATQVRNRWKFACVFVAAVLLGVQLSCSNS
jgi:hypothetical protein